MVIRIKKDGNGQSPQNAGQDDNVILPFRLEKSSVRGRMVRLGHDTLGRILAQHDYPPPVSALLSEVVTLCLLLAAMLKYEGVFTLQIKGDGPVKLLVADMTTGGDVRAYASFDDAAVRKTAKRRQDETNRYYYLLGNGYISFTVDQGQSETRYQGIVALQGASIVDAVQHYFTQSEQIKTAVKVAVHPQDDNWRTGAVMLQQMPEDMKDGDRTIEETIENWTRAVVLLDTCTEGEMLSPVLRPTDVLYRLFHEDGVRVYNPTTVQFKCRCSRDKVLNILRTIPRAELEDLCEKEGKVGIKCEFCSQDFSFTRENFDEIYQEKK